MDFVTRQIAIGGRADAENGEALASRGIDTLLSLAPVQRPTVVKRQLSLDLRDGEGLPAEAVDEALAFLREQVRCGRRVLVHCEMGISRSPALAAAYLRDSAGMDLDAALARVRSRHAGARPHPALVASLRGRQDGLAPIDLSANENPLGPSPLAVAAVRDGSGALHRYPDKDGTALRAALGRRLGMSPEEIALGNGSCELIEAIARICLAAGREMVLPQPAFPAYRSAAEGAGGRVVPVPMPGGRYRVEEIIDRLRPATGLVVVASPHNPTGALITPQALDHLRAALPDSAWLLVDEAYRDYAPPADLADPLPAVRAGERVMVIRSLSKVHGLAGLRIGYGIAPPTMAARLRATGQHYNTSSLAQAAAAAALDDEAHRQLTLANNALGLTQISAGLSAMGIDFLPSAANFVLLRAGERAAGELAAAGIKVKDMAPWGLPGHIRVSVGRPADNARFLAALADLVEGAGQPTINT